MVSRNLQCNQNVAIILRPLIEIKHEKSTIYIFKWMSLKLIYIYHWWLFNTKPQWGSWPNHHTALDIKKIQQPNEFWIFNRAIISKTNDFNTIVIALFVTITSTTKFSVYVKRWTKTNTNLQCHISGWRKQVVIIRMT